MANLVSSKHHKRDKAHSEDKSDEMDLSKELHPLGYFIKDREQMLNEAFKVVNGPKLHSMLSSSLRELNMDELKALCLDQLQGMSRKRIECILAGEDMAESSDTDDDELTTTDEGIQSKETMKLAQRASPPLQINMSSTKTNSVSMNKNVDKAKDATTKSKPAQMKVQLRKRNVGNYEMSSSERVEKRRKCSDEKSQMELLELEMRARAIKALLSKDGATAEHEPAKGEDVEPAEKTEELPNNEEEKKLRKARNVLMEATHKKQQEQLELKRKQEEILERIEAQKRKMESIAEAEKQQLAEDEMREQKRKKKEEDHQKFLEWKKKKKQEQEKKKKQEQDSITDKHETEARQNLQQKRDEMERAEKAKQEADRNTVLKKRKIERKDVEPNQEVEVSNEEKLRHYRIKAKPEEGEMSSASESGSESPRSRSKSSSIGEDEQEHDGLCASSFPSTEWKRLQRAKQAEERKRVVVQEEQIVRSEAEPQTIASINENKVEPDPTLEIDEQHLSKGELNDQKVMIQDDSDNEELFPPEDEKPVTPKDSEAEFMSKPESSKPNEEAITTSKEKEDCPGSPLLEESLEEEQCLKEDKDRQERARQERLKRMQEFLAKTEIQEEVDQEEERQDEEEKEEREGEKKCLEKEGENGRKNEEEVEAAEKKQEPKKGKLTDAFEKLDYEEIKAEMEASTALKGTRPVLPANPPLLNSENQGNLNMKPLQMAENVTWADRWQQNENVQKVVKDSKIMSKVRTKIKLKDVKPSQPVSSETQSKAAAPKSLKEEVELAKKKRLHMSSSLQADGQHIVGSYNEFNQIAKNKEESVPLDRKQSKRNLPSTQEASEEETDNEDDDDNLWGAIMGAKKPF